MEESEMQKMIASIKELKAAIKQRSADDLIEDGIARLAHEMISQDFSDEPGDLMTLIAFMIGY